MGMDSFAPYQKLNTSFIVKNIITKDNKVVRIFQYPILVGETRDLLAIPGVSEADIRASLLKGEILHKLLAKEITITQSDIDLLQFNTAQRTFLMNSGITTGLTVSVNNLDATLIINQQLSGAINNINNIFTTPNIFLQNATYQISVYYNGVRQLLSVDYLVAEGGGPGTGYNTVIFNDPPDPGTTTSYITADYYVSNL